MSSDSEQQNTAGGASADGSASPPVASPQSHSSPSAHSSSPPPAALSPSLMQQQHAQAQHALHAQAAMQQAAHQQAMQHIMMQQQAVQQPFDIDEFEAAQAALNAQMAGGQMQAHNMQMQQDAINQQANGMMMQGQGQQGNTMGGIEICRAYLAGRCSRGAACRFVHVENTAGHAPPNPHLCRDWLNGTCQRGSGCRFQHQGLSGSKASIHSGAGKSGPWSMKHSVVCHQWASRGRCDYGTACKFSHQRGEKSWNESALDEKKLLAAMLSGLSPQEALSQALNSLQASNPSKFGPMDPNAQQQGQQGQQGQQQQQQQSPQGPNSPTSSNNGGNGSPSQGNSPSSSSSPNAGSSAANNNNSSPNNANQQQNQQQMPNGQMLPPQQMDMQHAQAMMMQQGGPMMPQKRADGSLILCRFYARHGYCKYGVACKFHHQPPMGAPGMFPVGPNGMPMGVGVGFGGPTSPTNGGAGGNQSLAGLLALGLKASMQGSMMSQESLIANHAALLAANAMNSGGQVGANGAPARVASPNSQQQQQQQMANGMMPPLDPALASVLAAYLQNQQPMASQNPAANLATLLQQLQSGQGVPAQVQGQNPHSLSPTLQGYGGNFGGDSDAFQAFMQHQQQQSFQSSFSPAAASAFNAIPNLPTGGNQGANGGGAPNGGGAANNNLSLPQMINTAFRSSSSGNGPNQGGQTGGNNGSGTVQGAGATAGTNAQGNAQGSNVGAGGGVSSLSNNMSLMSLKPYDDASYSVGNEQIIGQDHTNSDSSYSSPSLLGNDGRSPGVGPFDGFGSSSSASGANSNPIGSGGGGGGGNNNNGGMHGGASTLSALFSSSLSGPFLH